MGRLTFRGCQLRGGNWSIEEGGIVHRLKFLGDLSITAARGLGLEDTFYESNDNGSHLREFHEDHSVSGERVITDCEVKANGLPAQSIAIAASLLKFECYTKAGKEEDDPVEARVRLTITTAAGFHEVEVYGLVAGSVDAVVKVTLAGNKQMKLADTPEPATEDEVSEEPEKKPRKKRGAPTVDPDEVPASAE